MRVFVNRHKVRLIRIAEAIIVLMLVSSVIGLLFADPSGAGPVGRFFGGTTTLIFYAVLYSVQATLIIMARAFNRIRILKNVLLFTYLTNFFVLTLQFAINGPNLNMLDNAVSVVLTAVTWLYHTMWSEYVDPNDLDERYYNGSPDST